MKRIVIFLTLVLVIIEYSNAQISLKPGFIITHEKDTIKGFLMDEVDSDLSERVKYFKGSTGTEPTIYAPSEILGFGFNSGRIFESITIQNDSTEIFAKRIIEGKINMFTRRFVKSNKIGIHLYRSDTNIKIDLKEPVKTTVKKNGKTYTYKDNMYLGQLALLTNDDVEDLKLSKLKYGKKGIQKHIVKCNESFENDYPAKVYTEAQNLTYDLNVGYFLNSEPYEFVFRLSIYRDKTNPEKSVKTSRRMGFSYVHYRGNERLDGSLEEGSTDFSAHSLSIIPVGFRFQGKPRKIMPYGYFGIGLFFVLSSRKIISNYEITGTKYKFGGLPTVNLGIGIKAKVKSNYILAEITPNIEGIFINLGYSF